MIDLKVSSPAFSNEELIPDRYTPQGSDVSPELSIANVPKGVNSFAIILEDPDAPMGLFVHWVAWNIDPDLTVIPEGFSNAQLGLNDFRVSGYRGPCPPAGKPHRYFFKVYALNATLHLKPGATRKELLEAMEGHIVAAGELMGLYKRS